MPGKYFEDIKLNEKIVHKSSRTVTEVDNVIFTALTMNTQPLHLSKDFIDKNTSFKGRLVNGIYTMGLVVGISVSDLTEGTIIANLGYDKVRHLHPVYHGDTIYVESEAVEKRESCSHKGAGIVHFKHIGRNHNDNMVIEFERTVLMMKKPK